MTPAEYSYVQLKPSLSDFEGWALRKAFKHIGLEQVSDKNGWYWSGTGLIQDMYYGDYCERMSLNTTQAGGLILLVNSETSECGVEFYAVIIDL